MSTIVTIRGKSFAIDRDGWHGHTADADRATRNLETALRAMTEEQIAGLHARLGAEMEAGDGPGTQEAMSLCYEAVEPVARDWHDPSAPWLFLSPA